MHTPPRLPLELWLPDLARFEPSHPMRALLRKADGQAMAARGYLAGLAERFSVPGGNLPAGALTRELIAGDAADVQWLCADPAWVQPDLNGARLLACGQMQLDMAQARALADALEPVFADAGMVLHVSSPDHWHVCLPDGESAPSLAAPEQALGEDLYEHLPEGANGRRWRVLLNEVQVILHQHPLNAERRERGLPPINSLWLWGGGSLPGDVRTSLAGVISDDVLLTSLARRAGIAINTRTAQAVSAAKAGWLLDLQDLPAEEIDAHWWAAIEQLALRQPLLLSFASGERWLHRPWHRLRFWRGGAR